MGYVHSIDPVMFRVGGFSAYWYGFAYSFGFAGMAAWLWWRRKDLGWSPAEVIETSIIFVLCILIGGRLFEVFVYEWEWYSAHRGQIFMLWKGGMATHGLLLGSVAGGVIASLRTGTPLLRLLDSLTVAAAFIFGVGRIGNFIEGGVIGTITTLPWGVKLPDVEGFRHPVSLYDGAKNLLLIPVLLMVLKRWPAGTGMATGVFIGLYGGLRFFVDQFRDYESVLWGIGPGQWFNLAMAAIGAVIVVLTLRRAGGVAEPVPCEPSAERGIPVLRSLVLILLILFPLCIPTSWTAEYLQEKREAPSETP
jgi:phosphatidylglycerol:prolipoprotein diacylglycerol transferase